MTANAVHRILVPTDLSDFATLAFRYAVAFSKRMPSKLTLLYADDVFFPVEASGMPLGYYLENAPESRELLLERLVEQAKLNANGLDVDARVVSDSPSRAIIRTANEVDADLIIMGTHGRRGIQRAFLGSVTESVLRHTTRPVLTIAPSRIPEGRDASIRTILCPVNFTDIAREALGYATELALSIDAELVLLYVAEGPDSISLSRAGAQLAAWVGPSLGRRLRYKEVMTHGDAAARVLTIAEQNDVDLIVVGSQHKRFGDTTAIGTTTEQITRFATRPVLTVSVHPHATRHASAVNVPREVEVPAVRVTP